MKYKNYYVQIDLDNYRSPQDLLWTQVTLGHPTQSDSTFVVYGPLEDNSIHWEGPLIPEALEDGVSWVRCTFCTHLGKKVHEEFRSDKYTLTIAEVLDSSQVSMELYEDQEVEGD